MIEIPESVNYSKQLNKTLKGRKITSVEAAHSPHKFTWYHGEPADYPSLLSGRRFGESLPFGSMVEVDLDGVKLVFTEGTNLTFHPPGSRLPAKHQLLLGFDEDSALTVSVQMYGGIFAFREGEFDNPYYLSAREKPSPLSDTFSFPYFRGIFLQENADKLSAKALLATEQRIPGLGNGVLQDILYNAFVHPKRKVSELSDEQMNDLFDSIKHTLSEMVALGGRDTEKDLFGNPGGYPTKCSRNTVGKPCGCCGAKIQKASYMGGAIYFCPVCQPL